LSPRGTRRPGSNVILHSGQWSYVSEAVAKITRTQYASPPEGNAIPEGHVQKRLSLNLVSLRDS